MCVCVSVSGRSGRSSRGDRYENHKGANNKEREGGADQQRGGVTATTTEAATRDNGRAADLHSHAPTYTMDNGPTDRSDQEERTRAPDFTHTRNQERKQCSTRDNHDTHLSLFAFWRFAFGLSLCYTQSTHSHAVLFSCGGLLFMFFFFLMYTRPFPLFAPCSLFKSFRRCRAATAPAARPTASSPARPASLYVCRRQKGGGVRHTRGRKGGQDQTTTQTHTTAHHPHPTKHHTNTNNRARTHAPFPHANHARVKSEALLAWKLSWMKPVPALLATSVFLLFFLLFCFYVFVGGEVGAAHCLEDRQRLFPSIYVFPSLPYTHTLQQHNHTNLPTFNSPSISAASSEVRACTMSAIGQTKGGPMCGPPTPEAAGFFVVVFMCEGGKGGIRGWGEGIECVWGGSHTHMTHSYVTPPKKTQRPHTHTPAEPWKKKGLSGERTKRRVAWYRGSSLQFLGNIYIYILGCVCVRVWNERVK